MCGLLAIVKTPDSQAAASSHAPRGEQLIDRLTHRGPDERGTLILDHAWLGHRRLAIVSPECGQQPITHDSIAWVSNSEIYNHVELRSLCDSVPTSTCDSAVIGPVLAKFGIEGISMLQGQFAIVVQHTDRPHWIAARDHVGICPLYIGHHADGTVWFASEMKALIDDCDRVELVEPGTAWIRDDEGVRCIRWYSPKWMHEIPERSADYASLRDTLIRAVERRMMGDVPWGVLLSGGLDSSLVASIANRASIRAGYGPIHTFAIGLDGSPDLDCARQAASFLGTQHHEFRFTTEEALEALPTVLEHLESDQQVRTAVPTYLLARCVRAMGFKMVLSGEGADEIFAGYLYFHKAPSPEALHEETVRKLTRLHQYDVMRANKAPMAFGLELRFPFLDKDLIDHAMSIRPSDRAPAPRSPAHRATEKHLLRAAFDDAESDWLPESILWRQKEQFSDGVGYSWVDTLREHAASLVDADALECAAERFPESAPPNAEMYWMRELFEDRFVSDRQSGRSALGTVGGGASVACSTPEALDWDPSWKSLAGDISGRTIVDVHDAQIDLHESA